VDVLSQAHAEANNQDLFEVLQATVTGVSSNIRVMDHLLTADAGRVTMANFTTPLPTSFHRLLTKNCAFWPRMSAMITEIYVRAAHRISQSKRRHTYQQAAK
jgi:hypothetical protein